MTTHISPLLAEPDPNRGCLKHIPLPADYGDIVNASKDKVTCPHGRQDCSDCMFPMDCLDLEGMDTGSMSYAQLRQTRRDSDFLAEMLGGVSKLGEPVWVKPIPIRSLVKEKEGWEKRVNEVRTTTLGACLQSIRMADVSRL